MKYMYLIGFIMLMMLVSVSAASADAVTRTLPATVSPSDTITVSLAIDYTDQAATTQLAIVETVPSGWTVISASDGGNFASQPGKISWVKASALGNLPADGTTFTYTVTAPASGSGTATFSGLYGTNIAGTDITILGNTDTTFSGVGSTDTVTRTLPATVSPSDTITVSLAIDYTDQAATTQLAIVETVPSGWTVISASDGGNFASQPGKISWVKASALGNLPADGTTFTYTVTAPASGSGTATFSGLYGTNIAGTDITILGNTDIIISGVGTSTESLSIGSATAPMNSTVTIPVSVANVTDVTGISFDLFYNSSVVAVESVIANSSFAGSSITPIIDNVNGITRIVLTNYNLISASAETPVIDIAFNITGGFGSFTSLDLQNVEFSDSEFNPYTPVVVDGMITVGIKGDFNNNGRVDIGDVAKVAFMVAGEVPEDLNADFNANGRVDIGDAAKIAFYLAGKLSEL